MTLSGRLVPVAMLAALLRMVAPAPAAAQLVVGDTETAQRLGCLELDEEDLALCSFVCLSKYDFGPYLRETLDSIEREG